jgi:hypothetical protein
VAVVRIEGYNLVVHLDSNGEEELNTSQDTVDYVVSSEGPVRNSAQLNTIFSQLLQYRKEGIIPIVAIFVPK